MTSSLISLTRAAPPGGAARVDGGACRTRRQLFAEWARALDFPEHFGHNWDAFADVLGDLVDRGAVVVAVDDAGQLLADEPPDQLRMLLEIVEARRLTLLLSCPERDEAALRARLGQARAR